MARYALIDGYLETMRSRIRWRDDLDDLVAEMEDHLYSTTESLCARGLDGLEAQRATLDRFGDPEVLQLAYASTQRGGIAMPTTFTRQAGRLALAAAALWLLATVLIGLSTWFDPDGWLPLYLAIMGTVTIAGTFGVIALVGLGNRLGGLGAVGLSGIVIAGLGVLASFVVTWAVPLWMPMQGVGLLLVALAARRSAEVPQLGLLAVGSAFLLGTMAFAVGNMTEVGWRDQWGDYPVAWFAGAGIGALVLAAGLLIIGRWLAGEEPVDLDPTAITA